MRPRGLLILVALLLVAAPLPLHAGGVVMICDQAHLRSALTGGGTVTFACNGTIRLTSEIVIAVDTVIDGSGRSVTIDGNDAVRVFMVNPGVAFTVRSLTVSRGMADYDNGGGLFNSGGNVTIDGAYFINNHAYDSGGAIANRGRLTVVRSVLTRNGAHYGGGAIDNHGGVLIVRDSTLSANGVGYGGAGINNEHGTVTVHNSTLVENYADEGGGIRNGAVLTVSNSTLVGNVASGLDGGGGIYNFGTATVINSTLASNTANKINGAGINNNGTLTLQNSIVANSRNGANCNGGVMNGGGNLSFPDPSCPGINADPHLGPLQNNGGPTFTMAILPTSAALDAGFDPTCMTAPVDHRDQRGIVRPQGLHCDSGAYELLPTRGYFPLIAAR
jgi:predicted outer membrane repeat protein